MNVDELQQENFTRGLSTYGTKKVLVERNGVVMKENSIIVKVDGQNKQYGGSDEKPKKMIVLATKKHSAILDKQLQMT
jgi:hypothetical protein